MASQQLIVSINANYTTQVKNVVAAALVEFLFLGVTLR